MSQPPPELPIERRGTEPPEGSVALSDVEELVRAAQRGDTLAMGALLDGVSPYVGRICGPIALDDGEDAAQEALIAVLRHLGSLREPRALWSWVRVIATREAVRTARRRPTVVRSADAHDRKTASDHVDPTVAEDVRDLLARLDPLQRAVLVLRDVEGLDEASVADLLEVPVGTVKSRLHRARAAFRKEWES
jgi:RNA polymerase sigma factor (sigma-70 family)